MDYKDKVIKLLMSKELTEEQKSKLLDIFPELKESEDERIRKALIRYFTLSDEHAYNEACGVSYRDIVAWLEKQGEQKPVKTPQWMIDFLDEHRRHFGSPMEHDERRDVDGKLLCIKEWLEGNYVEQKSSWSEEDKNRINRLIAYFEDKESFTAEDDVVYANWLKSLKDRVQPKQEWSEEDVAMFDSAIAFVEHSPFTIIGKGKNNVIAWLKSIRDKSQPQPQQNQEWSEEDDRMYSRIVSFIPQHLTAESYTACINWLKSLRPQSQWKPSDEYKEAIQLVYDEKLIPFKDGNQWCFLLGYNIQEGVCGFGDSILGAAFEFYKEYTTTRECIGELSRPQSYFSLWKPSDEQIKGIECAIKTLQHQLNVGDKRLNSLYDDLKKLMEK